LARREFPDSPIIGVGGIVIDDRRVLLVRRGQEPLKGEWSLPGGALELGETLEEGVRREVREETGLEVEAVEMVEVLDRIVFESISEGHLASGTGEAGAGQSGQTRVRYHYVLVDYLCLPAGGVLQAATDAADARWVRREELSAEWGYRVAPATLAVIEKAFALAAKHAGGGCHC
jgi:8-oxo-dGTP diphosphatase